MTYVAEVSYQTAATPLTYEDRFLEQYRHAEISQLTTSNAVLAAEAATVRSSIPH